MLSPSPTANTKIAGHKGCINSCTCTIYAILNIFFQLVHHPSLQVKNGKECTCQPL